MSISVAIDGISILDGIPPASIQASAMADRGDKAFGGFDVEDPNGTLTITGHRRVTITESDCSQPRLFTGWITERGIGRDKDHALIVGEERGHDVTTVDLNAMFAFRPISGTAGNRPAETWNARLAWLLGSEWLSGLVENDTTYVLSITRPMDAADYRDQPPSAVLDDLIDRSTYPMTYFAFYDPSDGKIKLYFNRISATDLTSTLTISNVKSELSATCFEPDSEAVLTRAPDQTYSEVVVEYSHGTKRLFRSRASTAAAFVRRGTKILRPYTGGLATATTQAENFLDTHAAEEDRISVTITVPPASAGLVWAGQRILVKFTHLPGYTTSTSMRVVSCTATPTDGTVSRYAIALELVAPRATGQGGQGSSSDPRVLGDTVWSLTEAGGTEETGTGSFVAPETSTRVRFTFTGTMSADAYGTNKELHIGVWDVTLGAWAKDWYAAAEKQWWQATIDSTAGTDGTPSTGGITLIAGNLWYVTAGHTYQMKMRKYQYSGPYNSATAGITWAPSFFTGTNASVTELFGETDTTTDLGSAPGATVPSSTPTPAADGTTVLFTCTTGYAAGTLVVWVDGIPIPSSEVTETDPAAGTFTLSWAPDADEVIRVLYIVG